MERPMEGGHGQELSHERAKDKSWENYEPGMHKSWITYEQVAYNQWQSSNKPRTSHRKVWTTHRQVMKELEKIEKK